MKVRRTRVRGEPVVWYVWADQPEEQAAIWAGLLEDKSPDARWRFALAWKCGSRANAEAEMARLGPKVVQAVRLLGRGDVTGDAQAMQRRLMVDEANADTHNRELRGLLKRMEELVADGDPRLIVLKDELGGWMARAEFLYHQLVNTMQVMTLFCGMISYSEWITSNNGPKLVLRSIREERK